MSKFEPANSLYCISKSSNIKFIQKFFFYEEANTNWPTFSIAMNIFPVLALPLISF